MNMKSFVAAAAIVAASLGNGVAINPLCTPTDTPAEVYNGAMDSINIVSLDVDSLIAANLTNVDYAFVATNSDTPGVTVQLFGFENPEQVSTDLEVDGDRIGITVGYPTKKPLDGPVNATFVLDDENKKDECSTPTVLVSVAFPNDVCWKRGSGVENGHNRLLKVDSNKCVRILHINDFHAYVDGLRGGPCEPKAGKNQNECDGGWAKIFTLVKQLAAGAPQRTLFIDAGDQFMGTVWSSVYKGVESARFLNELCTNTTNFECLGALGNHEFDFKYESAATYTQSLNFPVLNANIKDVCEADAGEELKTQSRLVKTINSHNIGFTAVTTTETKEISSAPDCITFGDETKAISKQTEILREEIGVDAVIAISHTGFGEDLAIAENSPNKPDLIVGGHSHTALWSRELGSFPGSKSNPFLRAAGEYPTTVTTKSVDVLTGRNTVKVVQAGSYGMFVGGIDIIFEDDGSITTTAVQQFPFGKGISAGNAFEVEEDAAAVALIAELVGPVTALRTEVVGETKVLLEQESIRLRETNLGNLICDAILKSVANATISDTEGNVRPVELCVMNSGGIRTPIPVGSISTGDVIAVTPFGNAISVIEITGANLILSMEHGLARLGLKKGEFPQIGGFILEYNGDENVVSSCSGSDCLAPGVSATKVTGLYLNDGDRTPVDPSKTYLVATNDFLARGGDNYATFAASETLTPSVVPLEDSIKNYISGLKVVTEELYPDGVQTRIIETTVNNDYTVVIVFGVIGGLLGVVGVAGMMTGSKSDSTYTEEAMSNNPGFEAENPEFKA